MKSLPPKNPMRGAEGGEQKLIMNLIYKALVLVIMTNDKMTNDFFQ